MVKSPDFEPRSQYFIATTSIRTPALLRWQTLMLIMRRGGVGIGHSEPSTDWTCGSNEQRLITSTGSE